MAGAEIYAGLARGEPDLEAANRLLSEGRLQEALPFADRVLRREPRNRAALALWGIAALELGGFTQALEALSKAASQMSPASPAWFELTTQAMRAASNLGRWSEAEAAIRRVEAAAPEDPDVLARIGGALVRINLAERGQPHLARAAAASPRSDILMDLAVAQIATGELEAAERSMESVLAADPLQGRAHLGLAELKRWSPETAHVDRIEGVLARSDLPPPERVATGYALFKELDGLGRCDEAWPHLVAANELARRLSEPWSQADERRWVEAMITAFPADTGAREAADEGAYRPIFILGLPRSGTTLVERVLAAHSQVAAMGELPMLANLAKAASGSTTPELLDTSTVEGLARADLPLLGRRYLEETAFLRRGTAFAIDKAPRNINYVGLIRRALPQALIVHMRREPMDALFGAYKVFFGRGAEWSNRLEDLAGHYANYARLAQHWRRSLDPAFIEVSYEALVADPGPRIRALLEACGLSFEPACLKPHQAKGAIATASSAQVRSPINKQGLGAWKRYERQLQPLRAGLRRRGVDA